tara:strand:- start:2305 stop:3150 length:846 start_codon:yes stop_codon:yes gene_type:complete
MRITKQRLLEIIQEETHNLKKPAAYSEKEWQARLDKMRKNKRKRKDLNLPTSGGESAVLKSIRKNADQAFMVLGLSQLSVSVLKRLARRFAPSLAASFARGVTTFALGKLAAAMVVGLNNPVAVVAQLVASVASVGVWYIETFTEEAKRASKYKSTSVVQRLKRIRSFSMNLRKYPEEFSKEELQQIYQIIVDNLITNPDFDDPIVLDQLFRAKERIEETINIKDKQQKPAMAAAAAGAAVVSNDDYIPNMEDFADIDSYEVEQQKKLEAEKEKNKNKSTN